MDNQSFDRISLSKHIKKTDFYKFKDLKEDSKLEEIINESYKLAHEITVPNFIKINTKGKNAYFTDNLPTKLFFRKLHENIKSKIELVRNHRNDIIREIAVYLQEGVKCNVFCIDIESFYESIDKDIILRLIKNKTDISYHSQILIEELINNHHRNGGLGLPRGIELSSLLAEIYLEEFDAELKNNSRVFLYKRFVDDIIIITDGDFDELKFLNKLKKTMPTGLKINQLKSKCHSIEKITHSPGKPDGTEVVSIEYLGYKLTVIDKCVKSSGVASGIYRKIKIGVSDKKITRLKNKISQSFYSFSCNNDFQLLIDRITFLSSNRQLVNKNKKNKIPTGIFYNYPLLNDDNESMKLVDEHVKYLILNSKGRLPILLKNKLSNTQKRRLLKISFVRGYNMKIHKKYSPNKLKEIARIWK
ncbi:antiviral reverse transcriptase Drt3a [Pantoea agglomerans]|uniref:antiviral reverse transcriptase Drt3a n=1 Tax=Enterobacter agglomerans TaxID=549 RepID=UPI003C7ECA2E